jgi:hypothetical protein
LRSIHLEAAEVESTGGLVICPKRLTQATYEVLVEILDTSPDNTLMAAFERLENAE